MALTGAWLIEKQTDMSTKLNTSWFDESCVRSAASKVSYVVRPCSDRGLFMEACTIKSGFISRPLGSRLRSLSSAIHAAICVEICKENSSRGQRGNSM